jgi:hypothetical protein
VAEAVGLNGAIVLQRLHYRLSKIDNRKVYKGERWVLGSYADWQKNHFPFWNVFRIQRVFLDLEKRKLIVSCQLEGRASRRKYYRIDYDALEQAVSAAQQAAASRARAQQHSKSACSKAANLHVPDNDRSKRQKNHRARAREQQHQRQRQSQRREQAEHHSFVSEDYQNQNQPARDHIKWPEFAKWCHSQRDKRGNPGVPTESGFWKWLCGQEPQWRNKVRKDPAGEHGYELDGKFYTEDQANHLALQSSDPNLALRFRKAIRHRDGAIEILAT